MSIFNNIIKNEFVTQRELNLAISRISAPSSSSSAFNITQGASLQSFGKKQQNIAGGMVATTVYTRTGSGILKKLWIATSGANPNAIFLRIYCDGVLTFGNLSTVTGATGMNAVGLALDVLFNVGGGRNAAYSNALMGSNQLTSTLLGGYIAFDIPFQTSLTIDFYNTTATAIEYSIQPMVATNVSIPTSLQPLRMYCSTFRYNPTVYGREYPLMSAASLGSGVYLKGVKFYLVGLDGQWVESRVRIYSGGSGLTTDKVSTTYTDGTYSVSNPYEPGATVVWVSSSLEDFWNASFNGIWMPTNFNKSAGILWQSSSVINSTTIISPYRFFGEDGECMPYSPTRLTVTLDSGDPQIGMSGFFNIVGQCYYYA